MSGRKIITITKTRTLKEGESIPKGRVESSAIFPVMFFGLAVVGLMAAISYYYVVTGQNNLETFVSASGKVNKVFYEVPCSKDYQEEKFNECKPKKCGRVVMDEVVDEAEAKHLLTVAKKGLALGGSSGGASILDLHSGALSKNNTFVNIYRLIESENIDLLSKNDFDIYRKVKDKIHSAIAKEFNIAKNKLYLTKPTFFSRMDLTPPKTIHDEYWHAHVDKETYGSFHYTSLLYLTNYGEDFTGGRFIFIDKNSNKTVEPRLGRLSFFTSGSENLHRVERLESGVRFAITVSFTCDPNQAIDDPSAQ